MRRFTGRSVVKGAAEGPALVARTPINFAAALTKPQNILPWRRDEMRDRHHELFGKKLSGTVLVFPACIGSTYTGMMLLELAVRGVAPAAMIVRDCDSLLAGGSILGEVWYDRGIPLVECKDEELYALIRTGDSVMVDASSGEITVHPRTDPEKAL